LFHVPSRAESILVITDEILRGIGLHIWLCARDLNTDAIYIGMLPRKMYGEESPKPIAEAMKKYVDAVVNAIPNAIGINIDNITAVVVNSFNNILNIYIV